MEQKYGSLLRAFMKEKRVAPKGELISFKGGLQTLVEKLSENIPEKLLSTEVVSIEKEENTYKVITDRDIFETKRVIITTPAPETAKILKKLFPPAEVFETIHYPPVAVASLAFKKTAEVEGFGFLTPSAEGLKILGAIFVSSLFPDRCPEREECFSVFLCGDTQKEVCSQSEEEILNTATEELKRVLNLKGEPTFKKLRLWRRSIPQYTVGYKRVYDAWRELEKRFPNLVFASNFVGGSSLAKCIEKGLRAGGF
jgi:oxygen-dependent protoporphyrinogen oxidase